MFHPKVFKDFGYKALQNCIRFAEILTGRIGNAKDEGIIGIVMEFRNEYTPLSIATTLPSI